MSYADIRIAAAPLCVASLMLLVLGCGNPEPTRYEVTGSVSYQGKTLPLGIIRFVPSQGRPSAPVPIASDGKYTVRLPAGDYRVEITAIEKPVMQNTGGQPQFSFEGEAINAGPPPKWLIPKNMVASKLQG